MTDQWAELEWRDGIPISTRFDDPYFSLHDGLAETEHVFLAGNDLDNRWDAPLHIAELGFGTGLNFLATWAAWEAAGCHAPLRFTSFERYPMADADRRNALAAFPSLAAWAERDLPQAGALSLEIIEGDIRDKLPVWQGRADAWFLDGFSPAKNPQMWGADVMAQVGTHTKPGGTFATYTAAGHVRRALAEAGFEVRRVPGFGRKRHMSVGVMPNAE